MKDINKKEANEFHNNFQEAIKLVGFRKDYDGYDYVLWEGNWFYKLSFEGYAYVLYKTINIYVKPLHNLFKIYNKFKKGTAQIALHYEVPIVALKHPQDLLNLFSIFRQE